MFHSMFTHKSVYYCEYFSKTEFFLTGSVRKDVKQNNTQIFTT